MKNHIAIKFLAVLLCTVSLFCSIVSVIGIGVTEQRDLYSDNIPSEQENRKQDILRSAARMTLRRYASVNLGQCPELLVEEYFRQSDMSGTLAEDSVFFVLTDPDGNILLSTLPDNTGGLTAYTFPELCVWYLELAEAPVPSDMDDSGSHEPMLTPTTPTTMDFTDPTAGTADPTQSADGTFGIYYWDPETDGYLFAVLRDAYTDDYSVTVYASDASFLPDPTRMLELFLWTNRYTLFWILGISLLIFAITAVYLCCAAGRKPGSEEIRAAGFNALPLDLYLAGIGVLLWLCYEVAEDLVMHTSLSPIGLLFVYVCAAFVPCLLFVAYCFAWAAQIKEGSGRWWRKSAIGFSCRVGWWLICRMVLDFCPWLATTGINICKTLFRFVKTILTVIWETFRNAVKWVFGKISGAFWWLGSKVERAFSLLPLTWQWILLGTAMVTVLFLGILSATRRYDPLGLLVSLGLCLGLVLYGAHAFGILLEGVRRMKDGDLENKVSDRLLLGAFRDFAGALNALADVVKEAAQKKMRSERMKTELITNVSHDIKTPLTSIINYVDLLQKPHTPEEEAQYLEVLDRKAQQLKKLIQDLMEMSKASTGNMTVSPEQVDAAETVTQALGEFADKLAQRQLTVVFAPPEQKLTMKADGRLVWRVLNNLLGNAAKYAMPGTRLYVDLEKHHNEILISLKNISAEPLNIDAEELMERFVRGDCSRNSEGSGLGLNIARSLMEVQGGTLELAVDGDLFKATLRFPAE